MDKLRLNLASDTKKAKMYFGEYKGNLVRCGHLKDVMDLYISKHFLERISERRLNNDVGYIANLLSYFIQNVFYGTTQSNKNYTLKLRNLRVGVTISDNHYVTKHRAIIVKTVFDRDEDEAGWYSNETIELKVTTKNNSVIYEEM